MVTVNLTFAVSAAAQETDHGSNGGLGWPVEMWTECWVQLGNDEKPESPWHKVEISIT